MLRINRQHKSETSKPYTRKLNLLSCFLAICIAIGPVELKPLRDFALKAEYVPHQREQLPKVHYKTPSA
jgi:hypothetical protein